MSDQLRAIVDDLDAAGRRLTSLRAALSGDAWCARPDVGGWSAGECVEHLNLTSESLLPLLHDALREARHSGPCRRARYRRDLVGWLAWRIVTPSGGLRTRAGARYVPAAVRPPEVAVAHFDLMQREIIACVRSAENLPIDRVRLVSPLDGRMRFNLYSALTLVPRHQHRHLDQAERACRVARPVTSPLPV